MNAALFLRTLADRVTAVSSAEVDYRKTISDLNAARSDIERRERLEVVRLAFARYCFELVAVTRAIEEYATAGRAQIVADLAEFNSIADRHKEPEQPTPSVLQN